MAAGKLSALALLISLIVGGFFYSSNKHLRGFTRARQDPKGWLEDSAAGNQTRLRILSSTPQRLDVQIEVRPGSDGFLPERSGSPPEHYHMTSTEWITVRSGKLGYILEGNISTAVAETGGVRIPQGARHTWWNEEPAATLDAIFTFSPPGKHEQFFRTVYGVGHDYGSFSQVNPLQWIVTFDAVDMPLAHVPEAVWKTVIRYGAVPLARAAGFKPFEDDYESVTA